MAPYLSHYRGVFPWSKSLHQLTVSRHPLSRKQGLVHTSPLFFQIKESLFRCSIDSTIFFPSLRIYFNDACKTLGNTNCCLSPANEESGALLCGEETLHCSGELQCVHTSVSIGSPPIHKGFLSLPSILGALDKSNQFRPLHNLDREFVQFLLYCLEK